MDLNGVVSDNLDELDIGVTSGEALAHFADAVVTGTSIDINHARNRVERELGREATVDAAAVIANFQRMVRIADGTGIPLDEPVLMMSQTIREDLGINKFHAYNNSPQLKLHQRILGRVLAPFMPKLVKRMAKNVMSEDKKEAQHT